jgi:hypothetical protein
VGHYLLTGDVRHRAPYDPRLILLSESPRPGSVVFDVVGLLAGPAPTTVIGQLTLAASGSAIFALGIYIIKKIVGCRQETPLLGPRRSLRIVRGI